MRRTLHSLLATAAPGMTWYQMGSIDDTPKKPFGVYRFSGDAPGITARGKSRVANVEIWVHDNPGSYLGIDGTLKAVEEKLDAVQHASSAEGEHIAEARFISRSPDLNDDGFRTICKMTSYQLIGRG